MGAMEGAGSKMDDPWHHRGAIIVWCGDTGWQGGQALLRKTGTGRHGGDALSQFASS
jgi:hypothetical protein